MAVSPRQRTFYSARAFSRLGAPRLLIANGQLPQRFVDDKKISFNLPLLCLASNDRCSTNQATCLVQAASLDPYVGKRQGMLMKTPTVAPVVPIFAGTQLQRMPKTAQSGRQ